jgi:DNA-binding IclR family transcriptional regulator
MTEDQKAVLDKLNDSEMSVGELSDELHIPMTSLRRIMKNLQQNGWVEKQGNYFTIARNYTPKFEWNFKPLLGVWK